MLKIFSQLLFSSFICLCATNTHAQDFSISGGSRFSVAVCTNGSVYTWGSNTYGQLGIGLGSDTNLPVFVKFPSNIHISQADGGSGAHVLALDDNKNVWSWGLNCDGQLGNNAGGRTKSQIQTNTACAADRIIYTPIKVLKGAQTSENGADKSPYLADVKFVAGGGTASYAIVGPKRVLMSWGSNVGIKYGPQGPEKWLIAGLLGNNDATMEFSNTPVYVKKSDGSFLENVISVDASDVNAVALLADGSVYAWGLNSNNSLGIGAAWHSMQFSLCATPVKITATIPLKNIVHISAGDQHYIAIDKSGIAYSWGGAWAGQTGVNYDANDLYAQRIHAGNSSAITKNSQVLTKAKTAATSQIGSAVVIFDSMAIGGPHGYLYTFGGCGTYSESDEYSNANLGGQLGQNQPPTCSDQNRILVPTLVTTYYDETKIIPAESINVVSVSAGAGVFYITVKDIPTGTFSIYVMGANNKGQLGLGDNTARTVATKLTSLQCK